MPFKGGFPGIWLLKEELYSVKISGPGSGLEKIEAG
jgi:hypothetical protein